MIKKSIYILITIAIVLAILFRFSNSKASSVIGEEASPIREDEKIVGLDYVITINEKENNNSINIDTAILSSISHYKDIKSIDKFFIDLKINNYSNYSYNLGKIVLTSRDNTINKNIVYKKKKGIITFYLKREDLVNYNDNYFIKINLEK